METTAYSTTQRQRLLDVLNNKQVDRVPVSPFIHLNFVKAFYETHDVEPVRQTVDVYEHFGFDVIHRNCTPAYDDIDLPGENWSVSRETETDGRDQKVTTVVTTPRGTLREVQEILWVVEYDAEITPVEYFIKSEEDFALLREFQPPVGTVDPAAIRQARDAVGDKGVVAPWIQGAFNHVGYFYRPLEELLMDAMLRPEFYRELMEYFLQRNMQLAGQLIDAGADVLSYGGNIASGKMIGDDFFREHVLPYEKRLIDFVQQRGAHVLYHNCGYASNFFESYRELGMSAYESLSAPPYGDTELTDIMARIGPEITLCGGIDQVEFLMRAEPAAIEDKVRDVLETVKPRGNFILGTYDYFTEDIPHASVEALARAGRAHGVY